MRFRIGSGCAFFPACFFLCFSFLFGLLFFLLALCLLNQYNYYIMWRTGLGSSPGFINSISKFSSTSWHCCSFDSLPEGSEESRDSQQTVWWGIGLQEDDDTVRKITGAKPGHLETKLVWKMGLERLFEFRNLRFDYCMVLYCICWNYASIGLDPTHLRRIAEDLYKI